MTFKINFYNSIFFFIESQYTYFLWIIFRFFAYIFLRREQVLTHLIVDVHLSVYLSKAANDKFWKMAASDYRRSLCGQLTEDKELVGSRVDMQ